jgi:hypothetical protein
VTAPDGSRPPGALGVGLFTAWSTQTADRAKGEMRGGVVGSFNNAGAQMDNKVKAPITSHAGSIDNHEVRIISLEDGGTMTVYSGNGVWTNVGGRIGVGVICGGQAGQSGNGGTAQRLGGNHGGYAYAEFDAADLPATVDVTVGAPGTSAGQAGGISSFGTYVVGALGTAPAIHTSRGAMASASGPGAGGNNGGSYDNAGFGGDASALAAGGAGGAPGGGGGGTAGHGQPGGSVSVDSLTPCGGGGGGAGGGNRGLISTAGNGGAGGAPGGGGGAGGNCEIGTAGTFGAGGAGRVFVIQSAGA